MIGNRALSRLSLVASLGFLVVAVAACQTAPAAAPTTSTGSQVAGAAPQAAQSSIKVGLNGEITGSIPVVGDSFKKAAELAAKEINDAGGLTISGQKYRLETQLED